MKNQINIKNLTPEQIEEVRQQLKAYDEQPKSIMDKVKTWEDARDIIKPSFWLDSYGGIQSGSYSATENHVPLEKHVKSLLATSQLMVIAEALNEGWKPNYKNNENKYYVNFNSKNLDVDHWCSICVIPIVFKSEELAQYAINQFPDLWYDYFMIDKPE